MAEFQESSVDLRCTTKPENESSVIQIRHVPPRPRSPRFATPVGMTGATTPRDGLHGPNYEILWLALLLRAYLEHAS